MPRRPPARFACIWKAWARFRLSCKPRGSIYTTTMQLGPKRPSPLWFWGPNSIIVRYMDPLGKLCDPWIFFGRSIDATAVGILGSGLNLKYSRRTEKLCSASDSILKPNPKSHKMCILCLKTFKSLHIIVTHRLFLGTYSLESPEIGKDPPWFWLESERRICLPKDADYGSLTARQHEFCCFFL